MRRRSQSRSVFPFSRQATSPITHPLAPSAESMLSPTLESALAPYQQTIQPKSMPSAAGAAGVAFDEPSDGDPWPDDLTQGDQTAKVERNRRVFPGLGPGEGAGIENIPFPQEPEISPLVQVLSGMLGPPADEEFDPLHPQRRGFY
jgi:hypothetical protein